MGMGWEGMIKTTEAECKNMHRVFFDNTAQTKGNAAESHEQCPSGRHIPQSVAREHHMIHDFSDWITEAKQAMIANDYQRGSYSRPAHTARVGEASLRMNGPHAGQREGQQTPSASAR